MGLETGTYINSLVNTNPVTGDDVSQGDDHIRLLKSTILSTFPNITGAVTPTHTELNYVDGVTSAIQTQLDSKISAVGNWVEIESTAISGTPSSVDFIHGTSGVVIDSTYDEYMVTFSHVTPSTDGGILYMRTTTNATDFDAGASDYDWAVGYAQQAGDGNTGDSTAAQISVSGLEISNVANDAGLCGTLTFFSPSAATAFSALWQVAFVQWSGDIVFTVHGTGRRVAAANVDGLRFFFHSGTMASGTIKLFGRKL